MAAQRPPRASVHARHRSPAVPDPSLLHIDDDDDDDNHNDLYAPRARTAVRGLPPGPSTLPPRPPRGQGREWTNFFTEDGVRLYRPSDEELKFVRVDPRSNPRNILFADDEPWLAPQVERLPPVNRVQMPRRGRSPTRRDINLEEPGDDDWPEQDSDSGSDDNQDEEPTMRQPAVATTGRSQPNPTRYPPRSSRAQPSHRHQQPQSQPANTPPAAPNPAPDNGGSHYRAKTRFYPTGSTSSEPRVLEVDLGLPPQPPPPRRKPKVKDVDLEAGSPMILDRGEIGRMVPLHAITSPDDVPDPGPYIRNFLGIPDGIPLTLDCLKKPAPGQRPNYSYPVLVQLAIYGSPHRRLTLSEIFSELEKHYDWFGKSTPQEKKKWKGSIRHNLSLNKIFRRIPRPMSYPGKGEWWIVDYSAGEGNKRERKRNRGKQPDESDEMEEEEDVEEEDESSEGKAQRGFRAIPGTGRFRTAPTPAGGTLHLPESPAINPMFMVPSSPSASSPAMSSPGLSGPSGSSGYQPRANKKSSVRRSQTVTDDMIDPLLRSPAGHAVGAGRVRGRSASRQTSSPYSAPVPIRRSARLRGHDAQEMDVDEGEMQSPTGPTPHRQPLFGQSSFGASSAAGNVIAPNNALGLGFSATPPPEAGRVRGHAKVSSHASASASVSVSVQHAERRSTRVPEDALPSAFNGGQRTYAGKDPYRDRRDRRMLRMDSDDDYD